MKHLAALRIDSGMYCIGVVETVLTFMFIHRVSTILTLVVSLTLSSVHQSREALFQGRGHEGRESAAA